MAFLKEYTMLEELGKGGFATVYKVRHNELGYIRAIRVLNETIVDKSSKTYQKFLRECKVLLRLGNGNHPNIVHIYQPNLLDNKALVEMDYVDGQDVLHYLKQCQNVIPTEEVIRMATQISSALAYCHEDIYRFCMDRDTDKLQDDPNDGLKVMIDEKKRKELIDKYKVIHNDIHSGNIMRREDGSFVLLDFGLAINGDEIVHSSRHTNGAPEFKAPEKWNDDSILTEQSDIYSFGIVLYQYLAGRVPFPYNTHISAHKAEYELGEAHQKAMPPSIEDIRREQFEKKFIGKHYERDYPQWLEDVIMRCLSKNPADRFKNGSELFNHISTQLKKENKSPDKIENKRLKYENKNLVSQISGLQSTNDTLTARLNYTQKTLETTQQKLHNAETALDKLQKTANKHLTSIVILPVLLTMAFCACIDLIRSGNAFTSNQQGMEIVVHDTICQTINDTIFQTVADVEMRTLLNAKISDLQKQITALNTQISNKDKKIKRLESELNSAKAPKSSIGQINDSGELKRLKTENANLKTQLRQKTADLEKTNKEIAAMKKANEVLRRALDNELKGSQIL